MSRFSDHVSALLGDGTKEVPIYEGDGPEKIERKVGNLTA